jgi:hypothetical protein
VTPEAVLTSGRSAAESLMVDTGVMRRSTGRTEQNPFTDEETEVYADLFTSRCKIQTRNLQASSAEVGGRTAVTVRVELHLPVTVAAVQTGDVWEVTAVDPISDPQLVGRKFRVIGPVGKSFATARRLEVEEVVS